MLRFGKGRGNHFFALLSFFLAALFLGWGYTIKAAQDSSRPIPGLELLLLAPMVFGLVGSWALFYPMERAAHDVALYPEPTPFLGRWAYVTLQARHNLLLVVPPLGLLLIQQIIFSLLPELAEAKEALPVLGIVLLFVAFMCIPLLLRMFLGLRPMPQGMLRERLEGAARRLDFRFSDILVWNTRHTVANAMVTGVVPWVRYIVITDRLIDTLSPEEIEGVFGHEVGHIKHHHMSFYILFLLTSLIALAGLIYLGDELLKRPDINDWLVVETPFLYQFLDNLRFFALLPALMLFAIYMVMVFGYLSRRCERQADIFGCHSTSPEAFINALERVAVLNGIPRDKPGWLWSWQHGTIGQRIAFLEKMKDDPAMATHFQRRLLVLKWAVVLFMALFSLAVLLGIGQILGADEVWKFISQL